MEETREIPTRRRRGKPVVVVTGSTALVGTALLKAFSKDYAVVGMDLKRANQMPQGAQFVPCDLTSDESVTDALRIILAECGNKIASVIHLPALTDFSQEARTIEGTSGLMKGLAPFKVEQFVFASTIQTEAEDVIRRERGSTPAVVLRIAEAYDEFGHAVPIAQQIHRIYYKLLESDFNSGDGDHAQPFVHLEDLVDAFKRVVARRKELDPLEAFLIAEPELMSYRELETQIGILLYGTQNQLDPADDPSPVSVDQASQRLAWQPSHRLREELPKMIARLKQNPDRWFQANHLQSPGRKTA